MILLHGNNTIEFIIFFGNFYFRSCDEQKGICSFPSAHVQLTNKQQLLMIGQPYRVNLHLEMPESPANRELGKIIYCSIEFLS